MVAGGIEGKGEERDEEEGEKRKKGVKKREGVKGEGRGGMGGRRKLGGSGRERENRSRGCEWGMNGRSLSHSKHCAIGLLLFFTAAQTWPPSSVLPYIQTHTHTLKHTHTNTHTHKHTNTNKPTRTN